MLCTHGAVRVLALRLIFVNLLMSHSGGRTWRLWFTLCYVVIANSLLQASSLKCCKNNYDLRNSGVCVCVRTVMGTDWLTDIFFACLTYHCILKHV